MTSRIVVLGFLLAGCGGDEPADAGPDAFTARDTPSVVEDTGPADATPLDAADAPLTDTPRASGCATSTFDHDGVMRAYILCVPSTPASGPMPAVLAFHGGGGNASQFQRALPWHETGDAAGFVTVYLQGCTDGASDCAGATGRFVWNVDKPGEPTTVDDRGFTLAVLDRLTTVHGLTIDRTRVFATGHSMGGIFTYTLRCDHPSLFAAIGPVSATPSDATCVPSGDTSIYHVHGDADANVPFSTGCCSTAQQTASNPNYLPACDTLPTCRNPLNWWPAVRTGAHPFADVVGLTEVVQTALGCEASRSPLPGFASCEAYDGCRAGTHAEECLVPGAPHGLEELDTAFDVRAYLWGRFSAE